MKTVAQGLAELTASIRFAALPQEVVVETKRRVLDNPWLRVCGYPSSPGTVVRSLVAELSGRPESTVLGESQRVSCEKATLANSTMLRYLDYMDSHAGPDPVIRALTFLRSWRSQSVSARAANSSSKRSSPDTKSTSAFRITP